MRKEFKFTRKLKLEAQGQVMQFIIDFWFISNFEDGKVEVELEYDKITPVGGDTFTFDQTLKFFEAFDKDGSTTQSLIDSAIDEANERLNQQNLLLEEKTIDAKNKAFSLLIEVEKMKHLLPPEVQKVVELSREMLERGPVGTESEFQSMKEAIADWEKQFPEVRFNPPPKKDKWTELAENNEQKMYIENSGMDSKTLSKDQLLDAHESELRQAIEEEDYERAARLRDKIAELKEG